MARSRDTFPPLIIPFRGNPIGDFAAHPGLILSFGPIARAAGQVTLQLRPVGVEVVTGDRATGLAFLALLADAQDRAAADSPLLLLVRPQVVEE